MEYLYIVDFPLVLSVLKQKKYSKVLTTNTQHALSLNRLIKKKSFVWISFYTPLMWSIILVM